MRARKRSDAELCHDSWMHSCAALLGWEAVPFAHVWVWRHPDDPVGYEMPRTALKQGENPPMHSYVAKAVQHAAQLAYTGAGQRRRRLEVQEVARIAAHAGARS